MVDPRECNLGLLLRQLGISWLELLYGIFGLQQCIFNFVMLLPCSIVLRINYMFLLWMFAALKQKRAKLEDSITIAKHNLGYLLSTVSWDMSDSKKHTIRVPASLITFTCPVEFWLRILFYLFHMSLLFYSYQL